MSNDKAHYKARRFAQFTPNKKLGQNFILDTSITDRMVLSVPNVDENIVLEIGPGTGALTRSILARNPKKLYAIEFDARCIESLQVLVKQFPKNFVLIHGDALKYDEQLIEGGKIAIIGNLPYNISTQLIFKWLEKPEKFSSITIMIQKEVCDRIVAETCTKEYGKLGIIVQSLSKATRVFDISPESFFPKPAVHSSIVQLIPYSKPLFGVDIGKLKILCHYAFSQRRKMLRQSLKPLFTKKLMPMLEKLNIDSTKRAEELSLEEFSMLSNEVLLESHSK